MFQGHRLLAEPTEVNKSIMIGVNANNRMIFPDTSSYMVNSMTFMLLRKEILKCLSIGITCICVT